MNSMRWLVSIFVLSLPVAAQTASNEGAASQPLDAARRDLQAIQAAREDSRFGNSGKPSLEAPPAAALPPMDDPALGAVVLPGRKSKEDKSHWLLDAMDEQKKSPDGLLAGGKSDGKDPSFLADAQKNADQIAGSKLEQPALATVTNPLTPYLNQWMTPEDYTLLARPAPGDTAAPSALPSGLPGEIARGTDAPVSNGLADVLNAPPPPAGTDAKANLYLAGIADFSPVAPSPLAGPPPATVPVSPVPPPAASPATPPPFASPDDTGKYFPQLKNRF